MLKYYRIRILSKNKNKQNGNITKEKCSNKHAFSEYFLPMRPTFHAYCPLGGVGSFQKSPQSDIYYRIRVQLSESVG